MTKKAKAKVIEIEVACDTDRLYGPIDGAIAYLAEVRDAHPGIAITLDEHWYGYEDMRMRFVYTRKESAAEIAERKRQEAAQRALEAAEVRRARIARQKLREYNRLGRQLGMR